MHILYLIPGSHVLSILVLQNTSSTSGLPAWWAFNEDHTLLLEADEKGYYPGSRTRIPSEGFISSFLQSRCKKLCRVSTLPQTSQLRMSDLHDN